MPYKCAGLPSITSFTMIDTKQPKSRKELINDSEATSNATYPVYSMQETGRQLLEFELWNETISCSSFDDPIMDPFKNPFYFHVTVLKHTKPESI